MGGGVRRKLPKEGEIEYNVIKWNRMKQKGVGQAGKKRNIERIADTKGLLKIYI